MKFNFVIITVEIYVAMMDSAKHHVWYHSVVGGYNGSKRWIWKMAQVCLLIWQLSNVWSAKISFVS
jgi:hypothetical protein